MSLDLQAIVDGATSHALALGWFDNVNGHEPRSAPGHGLTAGVWLDQITAVAARSGLASTSARVVLTVRVYSPMLAEPTDEIDPHMTSAVDALMRAYAGDFTLGDTIANVDLLGAHGEPLSGRAGYLRFPGSDAEFRIFTITLPMIIDDLWDQEP
jgi:hypothetical protein